MSVLREWRRAGGNAASSFLVRALIASFLCFFLSACQTTAEGETAALPVSALAGGADASGPRILGTGSLKVALLLPTGGGETAAARAKEIAEGAELALKNLGVDSLSIAIHDTADIPERMSALSAAIKQDGTRFAVVAGSGDALAAYVAGGFPTISLSGNEERRPAGAFAFLPSQAESLIEGIAVARIEKSGPVILFAPPDLAPETLVRVRESFAEGSSLTVVAYRPEETAAQVAKRALENDKKAKIFAFAGNDAKIELIAKSISALKFTDKDFVFVGNATWPPGLFASSALDGAIVAHLDTRNRTLVDQQFLQAYGKQPSASALYGYDAIAVIAGIARSRGTALLNKEVLTSPTGFQGVTGAFRFRSDTSVERLYTTSKIASGRLAEILPPAAGF